MEVLNIRVSDRKNKKYVADVIINGRLYRNQHFGDTRYQHYRDSTPIKAFSHLDHNDWERRRRYLARHKHNDGPSGKLSDEFLWN